MSYPKIAIIGAGPAALTLARLLQHNSIPCTLFERDADRHIRTQIGTLDLHEGSAQLVLRKAGLYDEFLARSRPEGEVLRIHDQNGKLLLDEGENIGVGRPKEFKNRPEIDRVLLREILLNSIDPASVHWGTKLLRIEVGKDSTYDLHFSHTVEKGFDLVVGADGAWSKVREIFSEEHQFYSGVGGLDLHITDAENLHPALAKRVGNGMCLTLGENRGLLAPRNGDGGIRVYAFVRVPGTWYKDCNIDFSRSESAKKEMIGMFFADWGKNLVLESDPELFVRPMYMLPVGFKWEHRPGVTLIGDATHLMTPFAGVGINVGMKDSLDLARLLIARKGNWDHSQTSTGDRMSLTAALKEYEVAMWIRAEENAKATSMYFDLFFNQRGAVAMTEHFEHARLKEGVIAETKAASETEASA